MGGVFGVNTAGTLEGSVERWMGIPDPSTAFEPEVDSSSSVAFHAAGTSHYGRFGHHGIIARCASAEPSHCRESRLTHIHLDLLILTYTCSYLLMSGACFGAGGGLGHST